MRLQFCLYQQVSNLTDNPDRFMVLIGKALKTHSAVEPRTVLSLNKGHADKSMSAVKFRMRNYKGKRENNEKRKTELNMTE